MRGDEIDGRDYDLKDDAFMQRFSYRFLPERERAWFDDPSGFRGTYGSVSSDEFYVFQEFRQRVRIHDGLYFALRHVRKEDLDTRYDRTLTGLGVKFENGLDLAAYAEMFAVKEGIDVQFEARYRCLGGSDARIAFVLVDAPSEKSDEFDDERAPFTLFLDGTLRLPGGGHIYGWANFNTHFRRQLKLEGFDWTYSQEMAGARITVPLFEAWRVSGSVRGEVGDRTRRIVDPTLAAPEIEQRFSRRGLIADVEVERRFSRTLDAWAGFRYVRLKERDYRPEDITETSRLRRREFLLHAGVKLQIRDYLSFWPGIYFDVIDNRESFIANPVRRERDEDEIEAKLNLPFTWHIGEATLTLNPTLMLSDPSFGGGNVQVEFPF